MLAVALITNSIPEPVNDFAVVALLFVMVAHVLAPLLYVIVMFVNVIQFFRPLHFCHISRAEYI